VDAWGGVGGTWGHVCLLLQRPAACRLEGLLGAHFKPIQPSRRRVHPTTHRSSCSCCFSYYVPRRCSSSTPAQPRSRLRQDKPLTNRVVAAEAVCRQGNLHPAHEVVHAQGSGEVAQHQLVAAGVEGVAAGGLKGLLGRGSVERNAGAGGNGLGGRARKGGRRGASGASEAVSCGAGTEQD